MIDEILWRTMEKTAIFAFDEFGFFGVGRISKGGNRDIIIERATNDIVTRSKQIAWSDLLSLKFDILCYPHYTQIIKDGEARFINPVKNQALWQQKLDSLAIHAIEGRRSSYLDFLNAVPTNLYHNQEYAHTIALRTSNWIRTVIGEEFTINPILFDNTESLSSISWIGSEIQYLTISARGEGWEITGYNNENFGILLESPLTKPESIESLNLLNRIPMNKILGNGVEARFYPVELISNVEVMYPNARCPGARKRFPNQEINHHWVILEANFPDNHFYDAKQSEPQQHRCPCYGSDFNSYEWGGGAKLYIVFEMCGDPNKAITNELLDKPYSSIEWVDDQPNPFNISIETKREEFYHSETDIEIEVSKCKKNLNSKKGKGNTSKHKRKSQ